MSDKFFITTTYKKTTTEEVWRHLYDKATDRQHWLYQWLDGCEGEDPEDDVNTHKELDRLEGYLDALHALRPFIQPRKAN